MNVGAPVTFRGVKIGSVTGISLRANPEKLEVRIPVVIEIEKGGSRGPSICRLVARKASDG